MFYSCAGDYDDVCLGLCYNIFVEPKIAPRSSLNHKSRKFPFGEILTYFTNDYVVFHFCDRTMMLERKHTETVVIYVLSHMYWLCP